MVSSGSIVPRPAPIPVGVHNSNVRVRSVLQLTPSECGLLLAALPIVVAIRLALWIVPSAVTLRFVSWLHSSTREHRRKSPEQRSSVVWAVVTVSRGVPRATCLTQALAAKLLLRSRGEDAQLCLGVAHLPGGTLRAHAWLERDGRAILGGSGIQSLVRLPQLPSSAHLPTSFTR
jgi:hypothetical protein